MKTDFWLKIDRTIIFLNKMESLISLFLILTYISGKLLSNLSLIKISTILIILLGSLSFIIFVIYLIRRVTDENIVRNYYYSQEGQKIILEFNQNFRMTFLNSGKPESHYIELEKDELVFSLLKKRQGYSYKYMKKLIDSIYYELNRN